MNTKRTALAASLYALTLAGLPGCGLFSNKGPTIEASAPYTGPTVSFDSSGRTHIARITCPTGGWSVRHDLTREAWPDAESFVTLVSPPAGSMVTQALVEHVVDTGVSTAEGCRLLIRRVDALPDRISEGAYREAARAAASPG